MRSCAWCCGCATAPRRGEAGLALGAQAEAARDRVINLVNNFFHDKLTGVPTSACTSTNGRLTEATMGGLTEQANGRRHSREGTLERAHLAWEESMCRPIDELGQALRRREPIDHPTAPGTRWMVTATLQLDYWRQPVRLSWPDLGVERLADGSVLASTKR